MKRLFQRKLHETRQSVKSPNPHKIYTHTHTGYDTALRPPSVSKKTKTRQRTHLLALALEADQLAQVCSRHFVLFLPFDVLHAVRGL